MIDIYYLNSLGEKIDFNNAIYCIAEMQTYSHSLNYETENEKIIQFITDAVRETSMTINISDAPGIPWQQSYDAFIDIVMYDIEHNQRGYLYVGEYYLRCNIIGMENEDQFREWCDFQTTEIFIVSDNPVWIREKLVQLKPESRPINADTLIPIVKGEKYTGKNLENATLTEFPFDFKRPDNKKIKYPLFDLPFEFVNIYGRRTINNESATASNFIMTIYGFCDHPSILIGGHVYSIETIVYEGERLVIDSAAGTVIKIGRLGERTNAYNARRKNESVFEKIQPGIQPVSWPGTYGVDIILFDERVQPKWNL